MSHPELPATELFPQLEDLGRGMSRIGKSVDEDRLEHDVRRRAIAKQLDELDRQYADQYNETQRKFKAAADNLRDIVAKHRELLFPGGVREKKLGPMTLSIRVTYYVRRDSADPAADTQLITRANNPNGLTSRGQAKLMQQVKESPGISAREQLVISLADLGRPDTVLPLDTD